MVCETANYKYIEERDRRFAQREESLGEWVREKGERRAALKDLKMKTRQASISKSTSLDREDISGSSSGRSPKTESVDSGQDILEDSEVNDNKKFLDICIEETQTDIPDVGGGTELEENDSKKNPSEKIVELVSSAKESNLPEVERAKTGCNQCTLQ